MSIRVSCKCGAAFGVADKYAGRKIRCPECGEPVAVRGSSQRSASRSTGGERRSLPPRKTRPRRTRGTERAEGIPQIVLVMVAVALVGAAGYVGYTLLDKFVWSAESTVADTATDESTLEARKTRSNLKPPPDDTFVPDGDASDFVKYQLVPNTTLAYTFTATSPANDLTGKAEFTITQRRDYVGVSLYTFQCRVTSYDRKTEIRTDEPSLGTVTTYGQWQTNSDEHLPGGIGSAGALPFFMIQSDVSWQTEHQTNYDLPEGVLTATVARNYFVAETDGDRTKIEETVKVTTPKGEFELEGKGLIVFDTARGCPVSYDFKGTARSTVGDEEGEQPAEEPEDEGVPLEFQYRLEGAE